MSTSDNYVPAAQRRSEIAGQLHMGGRDWPFILYRQELDLGADRSVDYCYMQPTDFRGRGPEREVSNFRSCVGYWWAAMQQAGLGNDSDNLCTLVLAMAYAVVNRSKGQQEIYRDAFPRPGSIRAGEPGLPDDILQHIRDVVERRSCESVKRELDLALGAYKPTRSDLVAFGRALENWVEAGVRALRLHGEEGLEAWLRYIDYWMARYRRRCPPRVRAFINFFAYQTKASFYLCYANFWIGLIPWLRDYHSLDPLSERFLRVWHNQNQPIALAEGRTAAGLYYPTAGGVVLLGGEQTSTVAPRQLRWKNPSIGPEFIPDVFSGQVLALHPLTWYLFADPALRAVTGCFFESPHFDAVMQGQSYQGWPEYWEFIGGILTAAHRYRLARDQFENRRGSRIAGGRATNIVTADAASLNINAFVDEYAQVAGWRCHCGSPFRCREVQPASETDGVCQFLLECREHGHTASREVSQAEISRFLYGDD